ncbi:hypothetical protein [Micromonospora aurantiaca (nom. illeg.)]|uniref:hypothetical protein n=1 Tax=Micromonospora aurantiaca (nom. illeg.) TaxID=47850 RepID=UPI00161EE373
MVDALGFCYRACPSVFLGRGSCGSLDIVWDTNVLIDYQTFGLTLWEGEPLQLSDPGYQNEVEALGQLIQIWSTRDVSFHVMPRTVNDAKRKLTARRRQAREHMIDRLVSALSLESRKFNSHPSEWYLPVEAAYRAEVDGQLDLFSGEAVEGKKDVLSRLPNGADRDLIGQALGSDMHVFLTRDTGILKAGPALALLGLVATSPAGLMAALASYGVTPFAGGLLDHQNCPFRDAALISDLQRMSYLIEALDFPDADGG